MRPYAPPAFEKISIRRVWMIALPSLADEMRLTDLSVLHCRCEMFVTPKIYPKPLDVSRQP